MNFLWSGFSVFLLVISMVITGCKPDTAVSIDEEREAYHMDAKIKNLEGQLAQMRQVLSAQSEALNRNRQNARTESLVNGSKNPKSNAPTQTSNQGGKGKTNPTAMQNASVSTPKFRKHVIRSNDTFYKLASHYRVDFKSIQSANPGVNSTKLQIGQVVNVPYSTKTASR
jgi:LysM repeat protein